MTTSKTTATTHLAALLHGAHDIRLTQIPTPAPLPNEVQIRPRATGICGTDMHYYHAGKNGIFVVRTPLVLGHEAAGEVVAVGSAVASSIAQVGDRVAIEPQRACAACKECRVGKYNLCRNLTFNGSASADPPAQGSLQEVFCHPASFIHKLPKNVSWEQGAMVEPLSVAVHAVRRSGLVSGQNVLVLGAGAIGLLCAAVAKVSGATSIGMIDVDQSRLEFAKKHGMADAVFTIPMNGDDGETKADFAARIAKDTLARDEFTLADVIFECTGVESCVNIGIHCAARGGKVVLVGMGSPLQTLAVGAAAVKEVDLMGLWRYANTFPTAIGLIASGRLDVQPLITHTFDLSKAKEALEMVISRPADLVKCIITSVGSP